MKGHEQFVVRLGGDEPVGHHAVLRRIAEGEEAGGVGRVKPIVERAQAERGRVGPDTAMPAEQAKPRDIGELAHVQIAALGVDRLLQIDPFGEAGAIEGEDPPARIVPPPRLQAGLHQRRRSGKALEPQHPDGPIGDAQLEDFSPSSQPVDATTSHAGEPSRRQAGISQGIRACESLRIRLRARPDVGQEKGPALPLCRSLEQCGA